VVFESRLTHQHSHHVKPVCHSYSYFGGLCQEPFCKYVKP